MEVEPRKMSVSSVMSFGEGRKSGHLEGCAGSQLGVRV